MLDLNGKSILLSGGTGSFGKEFVKIVLKAFPKVKRLVIFSRDELKQYEMAQTFDPNEHKAIRYFIGDIRDKDRFMKACEGVDIIIHIVSNSSFDYILSTQYICLNTFKRVILRSCNLL